MVVVPTDGLPVLGLPLPLHLRLQLRGHCPDVHRDPVLRQPRRPLGHLVRGLVAEQARVARNPADLEGKLGGQVEDGQGGPSGGRVCVDAGGEV